MKLKLNERQVSSLGIAVIFLTLLFKMGGFTYNSELDYFKGVYNLNENKLDILNAKIRDVKSTLDILEKEKRVYLQGDAHYSGWRFGPFGVGELDYVTKKGNSDSVEKCLFLGSVHMKINEETGHNYLNYHLVNGKGYLLKMKSVKEKNLTHFTYYDKAVGYKYLATDQQIYIPISNNFFIYLIFAAGVLWGMFILGVHYFLVVNFFNFLLAITNSAAFSVENVSRLRKISFLFLTAVIAPFFINGVFYLLFIANFSSEGIAMNIQDGGYLYIIFTIFFYLLYVAFKRGMILQKENELTI